MSYQIASLSHLLEPEKYILVVQLSRGHPYRLSCYLQMIDGDLYSERLTLQKEEIYPVGALFMP